MPRSWWIVGNPEVIAGNGPPRYKSHA